MTIKTDDPGERGPARSARRDSLFLLTIVSSADGRELGNARVRNLSAKGLMADCEVPIAAGDRVAMTLRGVGKVQGIVVWAKDDRIGVMFEQEIDPQLARRPATDPAPSLVVPDYLRPLIPVKRR